MGCVLSELESSGEAGGKQNLKSFRAVFDEHMLAASSAFVNPKYSVHTKRSRRE